MASPGRKLARANKRSTPEGKEQLKAEKAEKQASQQPQLNQMTPNQPINSGHQPTTRMFQRKSGNS
jgi:hypothetical protein